MLPSGKQEEGEKMLLHSSAREVDDNNKMEIQNSFISEIIS